MSSLKFITKKDGATAVEFALIAPVLLTLIMGIIELSLIMVTQNILEGATFAASRTSKTGFTAEDSTREETIMQALSDRATAFINIDDIEIDSMAYASFDQIGDPEPFVDTNANGVRDNGENYTDVNANGQYDEDMGVNGAGTRSQVVVYTVTYPWRVLTPMIGDMIGTNGNLTLTARTVVQNEPF